MFYSFIGKRTRTRALSLSRECLRFDFRFTFRRLESTWRVINRTRVEIILNLADQTPTGRFTADPRDRPGFSDGVLESRFRAITSGETAV